MVNNLTIEKVKKLFPRKIEPELKKILFSNEILVLTGSRQVGKTSLCLRLIHYLLNEKKVPEKQIIYLDLEFPNVLSEVNNLYGEDFLDYLKAHDADTKKKTFVFIDEVHYLDNPSSFLKVLHDHFPTIKLIVSGSSSLEIKRKFKETLTGRKKVFEITPLDFEEFLSFKKSVLEERKKNISFRKIISQGKLPDLKELKFLYNDFKKEFLEFLTFGGYPGVVLKKTKEEKISTLYEIYSSYIHKDIRNFAQIENVNAFNRLVELLANQIGNLLNFSELTTILGISRPTLENYLFLLEQTFVITLLRPFFTNRRQEIVKSTKVFFNDTGLRNGLVRNFDSLERRIDKGYILENKVFTEIKKNLHLTEEPLYWRTKTKSEVDFILRGKDILPIEAKSVIKKQIPSGLRAFIEKYKCPSAIIVNENLFDSLTLGKTKVYFLPFWAF